MKRTESSDATNEFSRPLSVADLGAATREEHIEADASERRSLAERFAISAIDRLVADLRVGRIKRGSYVRVEGRLEAEVVQECVVTLEPVRSCIEEEFMLLFGGAESGEKENRTVVVTLEEEVEPIADGLIDLGEAVVEQLALALPPYPRSLAADRAGVPQAPETPEEGQDRGESANKPFSVLASLKRKR